MSLKEFMDYAGRLKRIRRTGWVIRGIPNAETVAEHSYRAALLGYVLAKERGLNAEKIMGMLLLHDLAESIIGDIIPEGEDFMDKEGIESEAMKKILQSLGDLGSEFYELWNEFLHGNSEEAQLARMVDKAEMAYQAKEYLDMGYRIEEDMLNYLPEFLR